MDVSSSGHETCQCTRVPFKSEGNLVSMLVACALLKDICTSTLRTGAVVCFWIILLLLYYVMWRFALQATGKGAHPTTAEGLGGKNISVSFSSYVKQMYKFRATMFEVRLHCFEPELTIK